MARLAPATLAPVALKVKNAIEAKSAMCLNHAKPPVGIAAYKLRPNGRRFNYTTYVLKKLPGPAKKALWKILGDGDIGGKACKDADCLHPCYGPLHASDCHKCYKTWVHSGGNMKSSSCDLCEIDAAEWTKPHIKCFNEKMRDTGKEHLLQ